MMNCTNGAVGGAVYSVLGGPRFAFEEMASGMFLVKLDLSAQPLSSKSGKQISQFLTLNGRSAIPCLNGQFTVGWIMSQAGLWNYAHRP